MRIDRLWRAGPFHGGLWEDLAKLISLAPREIAMMNSSPAGKKALETTNSIWQSISNGRDMKSDGVSLNARILYTVLIGRGAKVELATNFIKSLRCKFASITFPPTRFDKLLNASPCLIDSVNDIPLHRFVAEEMSKLDDTGYTGLVYLEVACRALIEENSFIMNRYYDEVEVINSHSSLKWKIPLSRPFLAASKFLLITHNEEGELVVSHCPSSKILALRIEDDSSSVEAVLQTANDFSVFRSYDARFRWMYKQILSMLLGSSKGFWLRFGGALETLLSKSFIGDGSVYVKRSNFSGMFPVLAAPIQSKIADSEWGRVGACSRVNHFGGSFVDGDWEFELVSVNAISELPPISDLQIWRFMCDSPHTGVCSSVVKYITLPLDSQSIRRIKIEGVNLEKPSGQSASHSHLKAKEDQTKVKVVGVDLPNLTVETFTSKEKAILKTTSQYTQGLNEILGGRIANAISTRGKLKENEDLIQFTNELYKDLDIETLLAAQIKGWESVLTPLQREVIRKYIRILSANLYLKP